MEPKAAETIATFRAYFQTVRGMQYLARSIRVGAQHAVREAQRLEVWLRDRAPFNHGTRSS